MKSDIVFFSHAQLKATEGGMARNNAFYHEMKRRNSVIYNCSSVSFFSRILAVFSNILHLVMLRDKKVVILQSALLKFIFPFALFQYPGFRKITGWFLRFIMSQNRVFIEINDLLYEQAVDLALPQHKAALPYQKFIFSVPGLNFIFASSSMGTFAMDKYGFPGNGFQTALNGGPETISLHNEKSENLLTSSPGRLKFVYAGTLAKGREIDKCIDTFSSAPNADLYLIGAEGGWINELPFPNIHYLGEFEEQVALSIVAQCDVGIMPYDEDKLYYNLCYPTKNSFYIVAGIPILSTDLSETKRVFNKYKGAVFFRPMEEWSAFISALSDEDITNAKKEVQRIKPYFCWPSILEQLDLIGTP